MSVDQLSRRKTIAALAALSACALAGDSSASVKSAVQSPTETFTGRFALLGYKGQYVCIDPISKLVMVQTAVEAPGDNDETWSLWSAVVDQFG
jgi:hypothetical protein